MTKTVIRFQEDEGGTVHFFLESPAGIADGRKLFALKSLPNDAEFQFGAAAPAIGKAGAKLRDDLLAHTGIKASLHGWLGLANKPLHALHLQIECPGADQLPWEALVDSNGDFLALDANSPVARVLTADRQEQSKKEVIFIPPLRIACILGAWWGAGGAKEQADEWASLAAAIATHAAGQLKLDVHVFGCDLQLKAIVEAQPVPPGVTVSWRPIVGDAPTFLKAIRELRPHMLHLFAHGTADEQAFVQVSTVANVAAGEDGSILIGARDLRQEGDPDENIWVIALNACDSAAVSRDARNLATQLVRFGFPAVIGMREPVKTSEARLVSQHFYTAAFEALQELPIAGRREVEWSLFLRRVRLHLAGSAITAQSSARWLLPILYARTEPFTIIRGNAQLPDAERIRLQAELSELKKQRDTAMQFPLSDDVKLKMKADFDAKIGQIEAQLV